VSFNRRKRSVPLSKRGKNGRLLCRWCRREVPKGRRTFCGDDCVQEWRIRSDPQYVRTLLFDRDNGICAECGLDTIAEWHRLKLLEREDPKSYAKECATRKVPKNRKSFWDSDHVVAVSQGGGECGLEGFRSLCIWCHKARHKPTKGSKK
jgi:5-methylcytosine-specific restriction enzyme A